MGLLYLNKKSGFVSNLIILNIDAIRRKSMISILKFSFYQKSGIPEKEGEMASLSSFLHNIVCLQGEQNSQ